MSRVGLVVAVAGLVAVLAGSVAGAAIAATRAAAAIDVRFATVTSAGELVAAQSSGATSAMRATQGKFKIVFDSPITRCAVSSAAVSGTTSASSYQYIKGLVTVISGSTLYVELMSANGPADYPFSVVLACKGTLATTVPKPGTVLKPGSRPVLPGKAGPGTRPTTALDNTIRFATVTAAGELVAAQSYGATSALRATQGKFKIVFDASIAGCAVSAASVSGTTSASNYQYIKGLVTVISGSSLYVELMSASGPTDYPFSVVLACNP